jgi:hypothetical protein
MAESKHAATYPTQQYTRWKNRADELGMSISEFIEAMVEAGMKNSTRRSTQTRRTVSFGNNGTN